MSEYTFTPTFIPTGTRGPGRRPEENPFVDVVADLLDAGAPSGEALTFTIPDATWETTAVQKVKRQLAKAGKDHGVSVYKRLDPTPDGQGTIITFWAQARHNGGRKSASDE